jgi:ActR/RegA family two-component response regulator
MRVLLADDDRDQLAIRQMLLAKSGFDTVVACDPKSALLAAVEEHPACAIVDLRLPTQDAGLGLIRKLKEFDRELHILVLTGFGAALENMPERSLIDGVIEKGSSSANLIRKLKEIENLRRVGS